MKSKNSQFIAKSIILDGQYNKHCKPSLSFHSAFTEQIWLKMIKRDEDKPQVQIIYMYIVRYKDNKYTFIINTAIRIF